MGADDVDKIIRVPGDTLKIKLSPEEEKYREKYLPDPKKLTDEKLVCTVCSVPLAQDIHKGKDVFIHRALQVLVCEACYNFYGDGCFSADEDGDDKYCRWCGQGGTLYLCSKCNCAFCQKCTKQNLKASVLAELENDDWKCYICNPRPLFGCRTICWGAQELNKIGKEKEADRLRKQKERLEKLEAKKKEKEANERKSRKMSSDENEAVSVKKRKRGSDSDSLSPEVIPQKRSRRESRVRNDSRNLNGSIGRRRGRRNDSSSSTESEEDKITTRHSRSSVKKKDKKVETSSDDDSDSKSKREKNKKKKKKKESSDESYDEEKKRPKKKSLKKKDSSDDESSDEKSKKKKRLTRKKKDDTTDSSSDEKQKKKRLKKKKKATSSEESSEESKRKSKKNLKKKTESSDENSGEDEDYIKNKKKSMSKKEKEGTTKKQEVLDSDIELAKGKKTIADAEETKINSAEDILIKKRIKLAVLWLNSTVKDISELGTLISVRATKFCKKKINTENLKTYDDVLNSVSKLKQLISGVHSNYDHIEKTLDSHLKPWKILTGLEEAENEKTEVGNSGTAGLASTVGDTSTAKALDSTAHDISLHQNSNEPKVNNAEKEISDDKVVEENEAPHWSDESDEEHNQTKALISKANETLEKSRDEDQQSDSSVKENIKSHTNKNDGSVKNHDSSTHEDSNQETSREPEESSKKSTKSESDSSDAKSKQSEENDSKNKDTKGSSESLNNSTKDIKNQSDSENEEQTSPKKSSPLKKISNQQESDNGESSNKEETESQGDKSLTQNDLGLNDNTEAAASSDEDSIFRSFNKRLKDKWDSEQLSEKMNLKTSVDTVLQKKKGGEDLKDMKVTVKKLKLDCKEEEELETSISSKERTSKRRSIKDQKNKKDDDKNNAEESEEDDKKSKSKRDKINRREDEQEVTKTKTKENNMKNKVKEDHTKNKKSKKSYVEEEKTGDKKTKKSVGKIKSLSNEVSEDEEENKTKSSKGNKQKANRDESKGLSSSDEDDVKEDKKSKGKLNKESSKRKSKKDNTKNISSEGSDNEDDVKEDTKSKGKLNKESSKRKSKKDNTKNISSEGSDNEDDVKEDKKSKGKLNKESSKRKSKKDNTKNISSEGSDNEDDVKEDTKSKRKLDKVSSKRRSKEDKSKNINSEGSDDEVDVKKDKKSNSKLNKVSSKRKSKEDKAKNISSEGSDDEDSVKEDTKSKRKLNKVSSKRKSKEDKAKNISSEGSDDEEIEKEQIKTKRKEDKENSKNETKEDKKKILNRKGSDYDDDDDGSKKESLKRKDKGDETIKFNGLSSSDEEDEREVKNKKGKGDQFIDKNKVTEGEAKYLSGEESENDKKSDVKSSSKRSNDMKERKSMKNKGDSKDEEDNKSSHLDVKNKITKVNDKQFLKQSEEDNIDVDDSEKEDSKDKTTKKSETRVGRENKLKDNKSEEKKNNKSKTSNHQKLEEHKENESDETSKVNGKEKERGNIITLDLSDDEHSDTVGTEKEETDKDDMTMETNCEEHSDTVGTEKEETDKDDMTMETNCEGKTLTEEDAEMEEVKNEVNDVENQLEMETSDNDDRNDEIKLEEDNNKTLEEDKQDKEESHKEESEIKKTKFIGLASSSEDDMDMKEEKENESKKKDKSPEKRSTRSKRRPRNTLLLLSSDDEATNNKDTIQIGSSEEEASDKEAGNKSDATVVLSSAESSDSSDILPKNKRKKKGSSESDDLSELDKKKKKRRRIKCADSSDESGESGDEKSKISKKSNQGESPGKGGRKNIKKIKKTDDLEEATKEAAEEEKERRRRIEERQKLFNQMFEVKESAKLEKLVLDFDPDSKKELISVNKDLVSKMKPHQARGVKFMWDSCFESLSQLKKKKGSGCILAHCMGLGKTFQVVSLVHTLLTNEELTKVRTVMVVCPLSTVLNWVNEFGKWLEDVEGGDDIEVFHLTKYIKNPDRARELRRWQHNGGVLIMGYEMFRNLTNETNKKFKSKLKKDFLETLIDPGADLIVCDEGHMLKNEATALSKAMSRVRTLRRIVLTGTPMQNNLKEYHCMVQFVKPNLLGTSKEFLNRFVNPINNGQFVDSTEHDVKLMKRRAHVLHKMLEGLVQRFDYNVLTPFLPPKQEYVINVCLAELQVKLYNYYLENQSQKAEGTKGGARLFQDWQTLGRIWTHPRVLKMSTDKANWLREKKAMEESDSEGSLKDFIDDGSDADTTTEESSNESSSDEGSKKKVKARTSRSTRSTRANSKNVTLLESSDEEKDGNKEDDVLEDNSNKGEWWSEMIEPQHLEDMTQSGKLVLLFSILKECELIEDKVLVFSQSLFSLDLIEFFLDKIDAATQEGRLDETLCNHQGTWSKGLDYFRLDGSTSSENRNIWCKAFNREDNPRARLFLISTRAGGLGINLTAANRVIIFDASWNPSHDVQSIFRIYRFGQKKPCYVYRFVAHGTMEEKVYERQVAKQSISNRVVDEQQVHRHFSMNDLNELYTFTPATTLEERPTPSLPRDPLMAEILSQMKEWIEKYHEHDSLLENVVEEELNEEERKAAWEDYENDKKRGFMPPPGPQGPSVNPSAAWNVQIEYMRQQLKAKYPTKSDDEINQVLVYQVSLLMKQQQQQMQMNAMQAGGSVGMRAPMYANNMMFNPQTQQYQQMQYPMPNVRNILPKPSTQQQNYNQQMYRIQQQASMARMQMQQMDQQQKAQQSKNQSLLQAQLNQTHNAYKWQQQQQQKVNYPRPNINTNMAAFQARAAELERMKQSYQAANKNKPGVVITEITDDKPSRSKD